ncbi:hypothetical protein [Latilactobacillus curvatus]|uniref:hypothetical protein n=1 Tax=Latilactobacillus curvatus TaxID=28038 RepID=UPI0020C7DB3A|nr:hypothetical protein [Latilactobacillus curvatus]MCP8859477.1 hypothetical protein [Latilactobacillus curvatus]
MYGYKVWHLRFFNHFFVDNDNKFNWIGITSVLAIISLTFTAWDSRRKLKADLVSKNRIKWLERLKDHITLYCLAQQTRLVTLELMFRYHKDETKDGKLRDWGVDQINKNQENLDVSTIDASKSTALITLNLFRNDDTMETKLLENIMKIDREINNYQDLLTDEEYNEGYIYDMESRMKEIDDLLEHSAIYFKREWEKAKRGE